jgi:hypothetical protein
MSAFPEGTQPKGNDASKIRRNILLLAGIAGVAFLSLLVLLASPGLPNPPNIEQEAEATDGEDLGSNDTIVEIVPVSDDINSEMEDTDNEDVIVPNNGHRFIGGYVSYPGEVKVIRTSHGNNGLVDEQDNDEQETGGGADDEQGTGGGADDDDDQTGGPGSGGTGVCDPLYWQNHPENWPEPLSPNTPFSSVFGITIPGMEDLTLMEALDLNEGPEKELLSEGAAGMLNAMHEEIDYPKSVETVIRNVIDGLDPQYLESELYPDDDDLQKRIDLLRSANDLSCPLFLSQ